MSNANVALDAVEVRGEVAGVLDEDRAHDCFVVVERDVEPAELREVLEAGQVEAERDEVLHPEAHGVVTAAEADAQMLLAALGRVEAERFAVRDVE